MFTKLQLKHPQKAHSSIFGAFDDSDRLIGILGFSRENRPIRWLPVLANMDKTTRNKYIGAVPKRLREFLGKV
jgi:hypothetical protein